MKIKKWLASLGLIGLFAVSTVSAKTDPEADRQAFVNYFENRHNGVEISAYANGAYALNQSAYDEWLTIEDFPPYELALGEGEDIWNTPFANGKTYQNCFDTTPEDGLRAKYPHWDDARKQVMTLELAMNECRSANGEKPFGWKKGKIASLSAYVAFQGRGRTIQVSIPNGDALAAYEMGKEFYYTKRGQLAMSCADCHVYNSGNKVRADMLSPALGHSTHFPVYRSKWGAMGTMHRRYGGCNQQVRAKSFKAQGPEYRNLEYFMAYMNNGMEINGPGARK